MDYQGKLALITGGSSGIGLAMAKQLAGQGANITILARDPAKLDSASREISAARQNNAQKIGVIAADVADYPGICSALDTFTKQAGTPDLLVNAAGVARPGTFAEMDVDLFRWLMEINYMGTVHVIKALLPGMIQRRSGHIINFSSLVGFFGLYGYSAYGSTKFAIRGLSDVLRTELAEYGVRVSVVFPPDTQTPQLESETPFKPPLLVKLDENNKMMTAEAVAASVLKGAARGKYLITPGFDSWIYFQLTNFFGLVYPVMDIMVAQARRSLGSAKNNSGHQDKGNPDQV